MREDARPIAGAVFGIALLLFILVIVLLSMHNDEVERRHDTCAELFPYSGDLQIECVKGLSR